MRRLILIGLILCAAYPAITGVVVISDRLNQADFVWFALAVLFGALYSLRNNK